MRRFNGVKNALNFKMFIDFSRFGQFSLSSRYAAYRRKINNNLTKHKQVQAVFF